MDSQLSLRRLEVFRLVVDERSVTRAADLLMVAQPAVSAQLRALESWLGAKLFERRGNRLVLTEAGQRTNHWAKEVLAGSSQLRRDIGDLASGDTGRVIVSSSMAVGTYLLPPILAQFGRNRPLADITAPISRPNEIVTDVENGECDFAVLQWDEREHSGALRFETLQTVNLTLYATSRLVPPGTSLTVDQALSLPLIGAPKDVPYQRGMMAQLRAARYKDPNFVIRLGHAEAMKKAAIEHDCALIVGSYAIGPDDALKPIDVPGLELEQRIVLVHRRDKRFSPIQLAVVEAIRIALGHDSHSGAGVSENG